MTTSNSTRRASINLATTRLVDRAEGKVRPDFPPMPGGAYGYTCACIRTS